MRSFSSMSATHSTKSPIPSKERKCHRPPPWLMAFVTRSTVLLTLLVRVSLCDHREPFWPRNRKGLNDQAGVARDLLATKLALSTRAPTSTQRSRVGPENDAA